MITLEQRRRAIEATRSQPTVGAKHRALAADTFCVAIPLLAPLTVHLLGVVPGSEILVLIALPFLLFLRGIKAFRRPYKQFLILMLVWLVAQFATDVYRHTAPSDMARGAALIAFFMFDVIVLAILIDKRQRRIALFSIGGILSVVLNHMLLPGHVVLPNDTFANNWKFGYTSFFTPLVLLLSCYFYREKRYLLVLLMSASIAAVNLSFNARSLTVEILVSSVLVFPLLREKPPLALLNRPRELALFMQRSALKRLAMVICLAGLATFIGDQVYAYTASQGLLGEEARTKYETQSQGKYGILVGGRPEVLIEGLAVMESPIIGHGSYARDQRYADMLQDALVTTGYEEEPTVDRQQPEFSSRLPVHSNIMQAWIWAGFFGVLFWFYLLGLEIKAIFSLTSLDVPLAPYYAFLLISSFWDIWFSPFGQDRRLYTAFMIVVIDTVLTLAKDQVPKGSSSRLRTGGPTVSGVGVRQFRPTSV